MKMGSKEFIKLQKEWYQKLEDSGFEDLEHLNDDGEMGHILKSEYSAISPAKLRQYAKVENYYAKCRAYMYQGNFKDDQELEVWEAHCDGWSLRKTSLMLMIHRSKVTRIIKHHLTEMFRLEKVPNP